MAGQVIVRDRGAEKLVKTVTTPARTVVDVGIIGSGADAAAEGGGGLTVAQLAEWHEFGIGVPQRSFLRAWADADKAKIEDTIRKLTTRILSGKLTHDQAMAQFGAWAQGQVQAYISAGRVTPPNAAATVAAKGSSTPLIDTGQLRSSITHEVRPA